MKIVSLLLFLMIYPLIVGYVHVHEDKPSPSQNDESSPHIPPPPPPPRSQFFYIYEDKTDLNKKFLETHNYKNKLVYIDTRDIERFKEERDHDYLAVKKMAENIEEKGLVFMLADPNDVDESKKIINAIFPDHNYSYTDSPFIMGYTDIDIETGKREELIIDLTGMSKNCLLNYLQDVEQAIVRDTINELETRKQWRLNSLACEIPELTPEEYSSSIEKIFRFFKILF